MGSLRGHKANEANYTGELKGIILIEHFSSHLLCEKE